MAATASFLFRTDAGRIDRATWWRATGLLALPLVLMTAVWLWLAPDAQHDLGRQPLIAAGPLIAYSYLIVYAFAILFIAISFYNLSAKRWRDRGRPGALAGLIPFLALLAGAAHWLQPRVGDELPYGYVLLIDGLLCAAVIWTLVELGTLPATPAR